MMTTQDWAIKSKFVQATEDCTNCRIIAQFTKEKRHLLHTSYPS